MAEAHRTLNGKSMFGAQALSYRRSSPAHGFGSSTRSHASKIFMGAEHAKTSNESVTPGPCYELGSSVGYQSDGGKSSPPMWQFGTANRFGHRSSRMTPGPGAYENHSGFGKQGLSSRSSFPRYGFGTVDRDMASKVFISPTHAQATYGHSSPGPAAMYHKGEAMLGPKYGFGTDERFNRLAREVRQRAPTTLVDGVHPTPPQPLQRDPPPHRFLRLAPCTLTPTHPRTIAPTIAPTIALTSPRPSLILALIPMCARAFRPPTASPVSPSPSPSLRPHSALAPTHTPSWATRPACRGQARTTTRGRSATSARPAWCRSRRLASARPPASTPRASSSPPCMPRAPAPAPARPGRLRTGRSRR